MEILFLGTGAGELWPSAFCNCVACRRAIAHRSTGARIGACVLVDRKYLFDLPPNVALAAIQRGISLAEVTHLFVTHSHQDHFDPGVLTATGRGGGQPLHLYCNRRLADLLPTYQQFNRWFDPDSLNLNAHVLAPADTVRGPEDEFILTALAADHDTTGGEKPLIYCFQLGPKTILYACDTGWFPDQTWQDIQKRQYDAVMLDCTFHDLQECRHGHLSTGPFLEIKQRFEKEGLLKSGAHFIAQHIAHGHQGNDPSAQQLADRFGRHGVQVAYDGMIVDI